METHDFSTLPLLVRPGAVIPYNPELKSPEGDYLKCLQVFVNGPLDENKNVEIVLPGNVASIERTFTVSTDLELKGIDRVEIVDMTKSQA